MVILFLFFCGCLKDVDVYEDGRYPCETDEHCLSGFVCRKIDQKEKRCYRLETVELDTQTLDTPVEDSFTQDTP